MRIKKRCVVLLEVMIALALTSLLLTFLLGYYRYLSVAEAENEKLRMEAFKERRVHSRLHTLFARLSTRLLYTEEGDGQFSIGQTVVFSRQNGAVIDPDLTNEVISRLYVEPSGKLALATWPVEEENREESRKEVLMDGVKRIECAFYFPYSKEGEFIDEYLTALERVAKVERLPSFVRVRVILDQDQFEIVSPVVATKQLVRYL